MTDPAETKSFDFETEGLRFAVDAFPGTDGGVQARISVQEGAADFNALSWGAAIDGPEAAAEGAEGAAPGDGGMELSSPGLGDEGTAKDSFLTADDVGFVTLAGLDSLDDLGFLGVHATSATTPDGTFTGVCDTPRTGPAEMDVDTDGSLADMPASDRFETEYDRGDDPQGEDPDLFPEWPQDASHVVFHYATGSHGEIDASVRVDELPDGVGDDPDGYLNEMNESILASSDTLGPDAMLRGISVAGAEGDSVYFTITDATDDAGQGARPAFDDDARAENEDALFYRDFAETFGTRDDAPVDDDATDDADQDGDEGESAAI